MAQLMDPGFYHVIAQPYEDGIWIALYDTRRSLRGDRTALEAELLLHADDADVNTDGILLLLRDQLGLAPLQTWQPVTTRYGHGWQALFGTQVGNLAA
jgi:hypothetical protein